jgi:hypothetical protein
VSFEQYHTNLPIINTPVWFLAKITAQFDSKAESQWVHPDFIKVNGKSGTEMEPTGFVLQVVQLFHTHSSIVVLGLLFYVDTV